MDQLESTVDTYKTVIRSFWRWMDPDDDGEAKDRPIPLKAAVRPVTPIPLRDNELPSA